MLTKHLAALGTVLALMAWPAIATENALGRVEVSAGVVFEVTNLTRIPDKELLMAHFAIVNETKESLSLGDLGIVGGEGLNEIALIDFTNATAYGIGSAYGTCLCTHVTADDTVGPGNRMELWAIYASPPSDVTELAVMLRGAPPIFDLPIAP